MVVGKYYTDGKFSIETYFNDFHTPHILNDSKPSLGLSDLDASYSDGHLIFSFIRSDLVAGEAKYFDSNKAHYLFLAKGALNAENSIILIKKFKVTRIKNNKYF